MIEKIKLWFHRHSLVGYMVPIVVVALVLAWWWAGWPLHPYRLPEAVVMPPEASGIHVVSVTEADGRVVMALASTTGESRPIDRDYAVDYLHKGIWREVYRPRTLITGPQPDIGYYRSAPAEGTVEERFNLGNIKNALRDRDFPAGRYRLRYYDGLYEFTLD